MSLRSTAGSLLAFGYNALLGRFPSRTLRHAFLRLWFQRFGAGSGVQMEVRKHINAESPERLEAARREVKLDIQQSGDSLKLSNGSTAIDRPGGDAGVSRD